MKVNGKIIYQVVHLEHPSLFNHCLPASCTLLNIVVNVGCGLINIISGGLNYTHPSTKVAYCLVLL